MKSTQTMPLQPPDNRLFFRITRLMFIAVIAVTIIFGGYYIYDRYIHIGDMSPAELGISHQLRLVEQNPNDPDVRLSLAQSYIEAGNYKEAIRHSEKVLKAYPDNAGALILMGVAYSKMGNAEQAVSYLEQFAAIRRKSDDPSMDKVLEAALYFLGDNYLKLKQPEKAIPVLNEAMGIDTTDSDVYVLLGNAYNDTGQYEKAVQAFESTVRFVPDYAEAYQGLEVSYKALNQPALVTYAQGMQAYAEKKYAQASSLLNQSLAGLEDNPAVYLGLALTDEQLGDLPSAQANASRALALDPKNFTASNILARLQSENK